MTFLEFVDRHMVFASFVCLGLYALADCHLANLMTTRLARAKRQASDG